MLRWRSYPEDLILPFMPKNPPVGKYIASIENACLKLKQGKVDELRGEIKTILKKINISQKQHH